MSNIIDTYAAYSRDDKLRLESSSGAMFSLLAEQILYQAGVVYGVTMAQDCKGAEFIRISNSKDLSKLRGAKYLQARVGDAYLQVEKDLKSGLTVLFSGTGCQINGLKGFLGKEYEKLYCVDVICHGVPSPKLWRQYVQYVEVKLSAKLVGINYRCKDNSWSDFGLKIIDTNHKAMFISKDRDPYMLMFLKNYSLRPSCYECIAKQRKLSDLTIADFWGINEIYPEMNDGKGISFLISRTEKGSSLFDCIKSDIVYKKVSYEEGTKRNPMEYRSVERPEERNLFFDDMTKMSFGKLKTKYGRISFERKIRKTIKKIILKTPISKFIGGGGMGEINHQIYGMLFILEGRKNIAN